MKCQIVTERQKLMADQIKIRRRQRKDTIMNLTRDNFKTLSAATVAAVSNPQPYMSNLNNLNILCKSRVLKDLCIFFAGKQIAAQQTGDFQQDLENQQPLQFCGQSTMNPQASFQLSQLTKLTPSSALLPKVESPQLINSPLSTIGTEMSLSPRANSFDLGLLNGGGVSQRQLLSAVLSNNTQSDLKQAVPSSSSGLDLTPPHSAGLIAPIPVNPTQNQLNYDNLMLLSQLLAQQRPVVSMTTTPSLLQLVNPQQPSLNFQDILSLVSLFQQSQNQQISPPPEEKSPHKPNSGGFIDVCSV